MLFERGWCCVDNMLAFVGGLVLGGCGNGAEVLNDFGVH